MSYLIIDAGWLVLLAPITFAAGLIDTLAGGGSLITVPAFVLAGLSPAEILATPK